MVMLPEVYGLLARGGSSSWASQACSRFAHSSSSSIPPPAPDSQNQEAAQSWASYGARLSPLVRVTCRAAPQLLRSCGSVAVPSTSVGAPDRLGRSSVRLRIRSCSARFCSAMSLVTFVNYTVTGYFHKVLLVVLPRDSIP